VNGAALPKIVRDLQRRNLDVRPPGHLVAAAVQFVMMLAAQRNREFVAYLSPQRLWLREFEVVCVARCALADDARLRRDENQVGLISTTGQLCPRWDVVSGR
jgi:hypothetical protein